MARATTLWLTGVTGFLLSLEIVFRILPVSTSTETGYYIDPLILSYPSHHRWVASTGWDLRNAQTLVANSQGFVADRDFKRDEQAVALIGDSFVEASMLAASDRPGAQLERQLTSRPVYAMGNPGTALLDYAERIRYAHEQYGVRDFVVLMERGDVLQSLCGSGNVNGPCLDPKTLAPRVEKLPTADQLKRLFRRSALAQYFFSQLKFSPQKLWLQAPGHSYADGLATATGKTLAESIGATQVPAVNIDTVANLFFARVKPHVSGRLVIIIDSDRSSLYRGQVRPDPGRDRFVHLARANGAIVIDTEPLFQAHLNQSSLKLDVGPYDGHMNGLALKFIAQAAAQALERP